nr:nucleotidyltransferase family protein [Rubricella aquisinus]
MKEIPTRPQARGAPVPSGRPHVTALILAAGASSRMGPGRDKLLEEVAGEPLLARMITQARASGADALRVMLPAAPGPRADITAKAGAQGLPVADAEEGMAASIRAGLAAIPRDTDAILLILADMPEVTGAAMARLIAAFDPVEGRDIIRATTQDGRPGHPVLFGRRFFEALSRLTGDRGARDVLRDAQDYIVDVPLAGQAAITDLDTPEDWAAWRAAKS